MLFRDFLMEIHFELMKCKDMHGKRRFFFIVNFQETDLLRDVQAIYISWSYTLCSSHFENLIARECLST